MGCYSRVFVADPTEVCIPRTVIAVSGCLLPSEQEVQKESKFGKIPDIPDDQKGNEWSGLD